MSKTPPKKMGCLHCGDAESRLRRGLCPKHYTSFHRTFTRLSGEDQQRFEEAAIEKGLVLPRKKPGPQVEQDPFDALFLEMFDPAAEIAEVRAEAEKAAENAQANNGRRKPANPKNRKIG